MHRGWMDNPMFKPEPYTEREAWVWLIENAAWKDCRKHINGCVVEVRRGQVAASVRFLACAWKWNFMKVQRFLARMKTVTAIDTATVTGVNVITLCNYELYQSGPQDDVTASVTADDTGALQTRIKEKKEEKSMAPEAVATPAKVKKAREPKAPKTDGYTDAENAAFKRVEDAYPDRIGGQRPNMAKGYCRKIVRSGEASWEALALAAAMYKRDAAQKGEVGTGFVPEIQNFFAENGKYQSYLNKANQSMDKLRPAHIKALEAFRETGDWPAIFGAPPRTPGCRVPSALVDEILGPPPVVRPLLTVVATA